MDFSIPIKASEGGNEGGAYYQIDNYLSDFGYPDSTGVFLTGFDRSFFTDHTTARSTSRASAPTTDVTDHPVVKTVGGQAINVLSQKMPSLEYLSADVGANNVIWTSWKPGGNFDGNTTNTYYMRSKIAYAMVGELKGGIGVYKKLNMDINLVLKGGFTGSSGGTS